MAKTVRETADVGLKVKEGAGGSYQQCTLGIVVFMYYINSKVETYYNTGRNNFIFLFNFCLKHFKKINVVKNNSSILVY